MTDRIEYIDDAELNTCGTITIPERFWIVGEHQLQHPKHGKVIYMGRNSDGKVKILMPVLDDAGDDITMNTIEGEVVRGGQVTVSEASSPEDVVANAGAGPVAVFNPLDAQPVTFANALKNRQENYDALLAHLESVLVAGKDYGRIKVKKGSDQLSDWMLFAPGADRILGILGLAVHYPDMKDYKRACLTGVEIKEIIADCQIIDLSQQVIAAGAGACMRSEMKGDLNKTIKRACKRARLDAVLRLPVVSALFEGDFLANLAASQQQNGAPSARQRGQRVRGNDFASGAELEVCPIGKNMKGKRFDELEDGALVWIIENVTDKPDIYQAAKREYDRRYSDTPQADSGPDRATPCPDPSASVQKSEAAPKDPDKREPSAPLDHTNADWLKEYEDEAEWQKQGK